MQLQVMCKFDPREGNFRCTAVCSSKHTLSIGYASYTAKPSWFSMGKQHIIFFFSNYLKKYNHGNKRNSEYNLKLNLNLYQH